MGDNTSSKINAEEASQPLNEEIVQVLMHHRQHFQSFLSKRLNDATQVEDLMQTSLRKALEHPLEAQEETSIVAWFFRILRNALIDHYRAQAGEKKKYEELLGSLSGDYSSQPSAEEVKDGICECLNGLLPTLKDSYADLIRRIDLNGENPGAVAQDLKVTENNLSVRLHRARLALKRSLELSCGACTRHGCLNCSCS